LEILVTGVAGFIGSHLAERLLADGHKVRGLDCFTDYYPRALKELNAKEVTDKGVKFFELDLASDNLQTACEGVEVIYHSAAQPGISADTSFEVYVKNNIVATYRLLESIKNSKTLKCFINISTSSVYGEEATGAEDTELKPNSYYGVTKLAAEQLSMAYHRQYGIPACSLRLFSVYGERERPEKLYPKLIRSILEDGEFPLCEGSENHRRSFTYVGDIVDGLLGALNNIDKCVGEIFNIGSDKEMTTGQGIKIVEEIIGKKAKISKVPKRPGDQLRTWANIEKARKHFGYDPKTVPEEGLRTEVEWYKKRVFGKVEY
jgi:nucleoside-diphosphate-sugar epimerase